MLQFLGIDVERKHRVLPQHVLDKCVVYLLKISLSNPDTYLKVKKYTFWIFDRRATEEAITSR